jgi:hypothetical protein
VAQQIFPQDHFLARKYHLGVPIRKFYFDRPHRYVSRFFLLGIQLSVVALLGFICMGYGLYLDVTITISQQLVWLWGWIFIALLVPGMAGFILHLYGKRRVVMINFVGCFVSLLIVTLWSTIFFLHRPQLNPVSILLSGLSLQAIGLLLVGLTFHFAPLSRSILICADGCIFTDKLQRKKVVRWDQITSMRLGKGFASIVCSNGTALKLRSKWASSTTVQHLIYGKAFRYLLTRARACFPGRSCVPVSILTPVLPLLVKMILVWISLICLFSLMPLYS